MKAYLPALLEQDSLEIIFFCDLQIAHYCKLYRRYAMSWRFKAALFVWKRMQYYKQLRHQIELDIHDVNTLINQINTDNKYLPSITLNSIQ